MSQQGLRQASVRAESGTELTYEGDWHALWDGMGIEEGTFNERMLIYCGEKLGTTFTNINDAMTALAIDQGATNFGSMGTFDASVGPAYEAESETLFAAMSPAPDETREGHINTLIAALKTAGVWVKLDVLYVLAAHSAAPARLNWKVPASYEATAVNSPTFTTDRGYAGNGSSSYVNTTFVPSTNGVAYTRDSANIAVWNRSVSTNAVPHVGFDGTAGCLYCRYGDGNTYPFIHGGAVGYPNPNSNGLIMAQRINATNYAAYRNGAVLGVLSATASVAIPAGTLTIGSVPAVGFTPDEMAAASVGASLSAGELTDYYNAMQAYMTAVGA